MKRNFMDNKVATSLEQFLTNLGFNYATDFNKDTDLLKKLNVDLAYQVGDVSTIYFTYLSGPELAHNLFKLHQNIWNYKRTEVFVVISDTETLLCASAYKPDERDPFNCKLKDFAYGINSPSFEPDKIKPLLKENIDFGFFWDFVRKQIKEGKRETVDYDLLSNLIKLKNDLSPRLKAEQKYILIERCLFIKFLEDRGFLQSETLTEILKCNDAQMLIDKFNKINIYLNGDIFDEKIFTAQEIPRNTLRKLFGFFTKDYRNRQERLFPYKFDIIPVELLSNIYEAFLKANTRTSNGIYYTPSNLVDLILNETLIPKLKRNPKPTCFDFACGSGIFLVKALEKIIEKNKCNSEFEKKKELLKACIFGVEKDKVAARITIFSLYLTILDGEDPEKLRELIKMDKIKFPKLLDKNILNNDTLFDELNFASVNGNKFDFFDIIIGNPPWSVNPFRGVQSGTTMKLAREKQDAVNDYQSSQYFTLKSEDFMNNGSIAGIVFNNSNLLMRNAESFRKQILKNYTINTIYELSRCNSILFKKHKIGDLNIGADFPPVVIIFQKKNQRLENEISYITPTLDLLSKFLKKFIIKSSEITRIKQSMLYEDDKLWRFPTIGDMGDYSLIRKLRMQKGQKHKVLYGFQATKSEKYKIIMKDKISYVDKDCVTPFVLMKDQINITQRHGIKIRRMCGGYNPNTREFAREKLLIKRKIEKNYLKVKAVYDNIGYPFKEDLFGLYPVNNYRLLLSFYNSSLVSYFLYFTSSQIGKGTWNMLNKNEIESIPIPLEKDIPSKYKEKLIELTGQILETGVADAKILQEIDEVIFSVYHLKEFEKLRIKDFFYIRSREQRRTTTLVKEKELQSYADTFRDVFDFILKEDKYLNAEGFISYTFGTGISFVLTNVNKKIGNIKFTDGTNIRNFVRIVTKQQINDSQKMSILRQEKVKLYDTDRFTIIKSNLFKDWSKTEAIKDAKEEIGLFIKQLPRRRNK